PSAGKEDAVDSARRSLAGTQCVHAALNEPKLKVGVNPDTRRLIEWRHPPTLRLTLRRLATLRREPMSTRSATFCSVPKCGTTRDDSQALRSGWLRLWTAFVKRPRSKWTHLRPSLVRRLNHWASASRPKRQTVLILSNNLPTTCKKLRRGWRKKSP